MFGKKQAKLTGELGRRSPRRWPVIVAIALFPMLAYFTVQLFGAGQPRKPEPQATAAKPSASAAPTKLTAAESAKFWAQVDKENKALDAKYQAQTDASNARTEPTQVAPVEAQPVETQPADPVWHEVGDYLYRYADKSEYSCDYFDCVVVRVKTMAPSGCPGGFYVEASIDDAGGASVGRDNAITAALPQGKEAIVKLTDTSDMGEKFVLTELYCRGE